MQSLRMDEPDMLLMDEHGGDDDTDPFTARCMSFQVTSTATLAPSQLPHCSRGVTWSQPCILCMPEIVDTAGRSFTCTRMYFVSTVFSWLCTPAVCSKEAKSSRRSSATGTCCGHCLALTSSSVNGPNHCAGNSSRKSCPMFQLQNVIPVKR